MDKKPRTGDKSSKKVHTKLKRKLTEKGDKDESQKVDQISSENDLDISFMRKNKLKNANKERKNGKLISKKKRKKEETVVHFDTVDDEFNYRDEGSSEKLKYKSKKAGKSKKKNRLTSKKERKLEEHKSEVEFEEDIYHLSSGDNDCSKGMKKWITKYHRSRPGLEILQQSIDECITVLEAQQEQARKEREARAAEGGWTVVVHHKGRKRTTDSESGISVGSVAQAAIVDKMAKKKKKAVALNFYNFQRREAQRNEVMMLQSKFEQDKRRIQQMRAARKFRPY